MPTSSVAATGISTHWHVPTKSVLELLGGLIITFLLAGIAVTGVQSLAAGMVFLWIDFGIYALFLLVAGIHATANLHGGKAALVTLALVGLLLPGLWGRSAMAGWLTRQKAIQTAAQQLPPPPAPVPPVGQTSLDPKPQSAPAPKGHPGGPRVDIRQSGKTNTANPGVNTASIQQGDCGVVQVGGSNNTASPNCTPPPVTHAGHIHGDNNTTVGKTQFGSIDGSGNTIVGATDSAGNTDLSHGGTTIGNGACGCPTCVVIGAHAGCASSSLPPPDTAPKQP